jgi:hypothetical protein
MTSTTSDATTQTKSKEEPADGEASGAPPPRPAPGAADSEGTTTGSSFVITTPSQLTNQGDGGIGNPSAALPADEPASGAMDDPQAPQDGYKDTEKANDGECCEWVVVPAGREDGREEYTATGTEEANEVDEMF